MLPSALTVPPLHNVHNMDKNAVSLQKKQKQIVIYITQNADYIHNQYSNIQFYIHKK